MNERMNEKGKLFLREDSQLINGKGIMEVGNHHEAGITGVIFPGKNREHMQNQ